MHAEEEKQNTGYIQRRELNLEERVSIIKESENKIRTGIIAHKYNCSHDQVRAIIRRKKDYLALWAESPDKQVIKRLRNPLLLATGKILFEWVKRARFYKAVTDEDLRETGRVIANHINYEDFRPKLRWLNRFKNKYRLHSDKSRSFRQEVGIRRKSLKIADIIDSMKNDDPLSLIELDIENGVGNVKKTSGSSSQEHVNNYQLMETRHGGLLQKLEKAGDDPVKIKMEKPANNAIHLVPAKEIRSYREALNSLEPIEQFVLLKENLRAVGLVNQLENLLRNELEKTGG